MCWKYCVNSYRAMSVIRTLRSAVVKHCLQVWSPTIQWQPGSVRLLAPQLGHSHNWWRCNRGWFSLLIINHSPPQLCPAPDLDTAVNTVNTNIISWIRDPWINNGPINRSSIVIIESMLHNHQSKVSLELIVKIVFNTSLHIKSFQFFKSFKIKYSWPSFNILLLKIVIFVECPEAKFEGCLESGKYQHTVDRRQWSETTRRI